MLLHRLWITIFGSNCSFIVRLQLFIARIRARKRNISIDLDDCEVNYGLSIGVTVG